MTEQEWLECSKPGQLLIRMHASKKPRKERLFACACCRHVWHLMTDPRCRRAVEVSEQFADGFASAQEFAEAQTGVEAARANQRYGGFDRESHLATAAGAALEGRTGAAHSVRIAIRWVDGEQASLQEQAYHCWLIHEIFPNPFRPMSVDPFWQTGTVVPLAQSIYDERAFDRLPILADALEEAGCTNADILNHCRQPGEHVRGCWVVDLLLGRE
jgi:hypothetical protein